MQCMFDRSPFANDPEPREPSPTAPMSERYISRALASVSYVEPTPMSAPQFTIYGVKHIDDGIVYVGQTSLTIERRWALHLADARKGISKFNDFVREEGDMMFALQVLEVVKTALEANDAEERWIAKFNTRALGYNSTRGRAADRAPATPQYDSMSLNRPRPVRPYSRAFGGYGSTDR